MSAAEFALTGCVLVISISGAHELFRIQYSASVVDYLAYSYAAELSYQNLSHILSDRYSKDFESQKRVIEPLERELEREVSNVFKSSILGWSWTSYEQRTPLKGIRIWIRGPHWNDLTAENHVKIQICLQSWLAPLLRVISDKRNCLGQFTSENSARQPSRGISITAEARRNANIAIYPYFFAKKNSDDRNENGALSGMPLLKKGSALNGQ